MELEGQMIAALAASEDGREGVDASWSGATPTTSSRPTKPAGGQ